MSANISASVILMGVIVVVSAMAFGNPKLRASLIMNPYIISRRGEYHRLLTSGFIHADWMHLGFNMFSLYFFSISTNPQIKGVEQILGPVAYLALFLLGVVVSSIPTFFQHKDSPHYNALGASGGVAAVIFSFIVFHPLRKIHLFIFPGVPGFILGVLYMIYSYFSSKQNRDNIGHSAHLTGAIFGIVFSFIIEPELAIAGIKTIKNWSLFN